MEDPCRVIHDLTVDLSFFGAHRALQHKICAMAVSPKEMIVADFFSGLGAYALAAERAGARLAMLCENDPFCQRLLRKHWPDTPIYDDIRNVTRPALRRDGIAFDVAVAGWPCQGFSSAGAGLGLDDPRSGLFVEVCRVLGAFRPGGVVLENSANLLSGPAERPGQWFGYVLGELASLGYDAEWHCLSAAAFDAPHIRDRVWIIATLSDASRVGRRARRPKSTGQPRRPVPDRDSLVAYAHSIAPIGSAIARQERFSWPAEPDVGRVVHGAPDRVDRIHALGNCNPPIIPQTIISAMIAHATGLKSARVEESKDG